MRLRDYDRDAEPLGANEDRPMTRFASVLLLFFIAGTQAAMAQAELVIPVTDAEAQQVLQFDEADELSHADLSWKSSGRIRVAKINLAALRLNGEYVQFTPFPDVEPIVMISHGIGGEYGRTWTGERYTGRIEGIPTAAEIEQEFARGITPMATHLGTDQSIEVSDGMLASIKQTLNEEFGRVNKVTLSVGNILMDARTREFLLDPDLQENESFLINPKTGNKKYIKGLEASYKWLVEKAGDEYPCEKRNTRTLEIALEERGNMGGFGGAAGSNQADPKTGRPEFVDDKTGHVTNSLKGYVVESSHGATVALPCKPEGDVIDRMIAFREAHGEESDFKDYERVKELPPSADYFESVGGMIADKGSHPFQASDPAQAEKNLKHNQSVRNYRISPLLRHPEYVLIYELDKDRYHEMRTFDVHSYDPENLPEFEPTDLDRKHERLRKENEAHVEAAKARRDARNKSRGDK